MVTCLGGTEVNIKKMTQEEKQEILRDLCARLPYGIKILHRGEIEEIAEITLEGLFQNRSYNAWFDISTCKPYLRPMSSMTEEENIERKKLGILLAFGDNHKTIFSGFGAISGEDIIKCFNWLNAHHFDFRNLIPKGLAIEAPDGMYNLNEK